MGHIAHLRKQFKSIKTYDLFFHLNPHPRMLCAKIGWNWLSGSGEEIFLILSMYFRYFCNNLPFEMGWVLHLNKLDSPFTQGCIVTSLVENGPVVLEKKMKMWKVYRQTDGRTDRRTDDRWSEKLTWAFSSGELKIKEKKPNDYLSDLSRECDGRHLMNNLLLSLVELVLRSNRIDCPLKESFYTY